MKGHRVARSPMHFIRIFWGDPKKRRRTLLFVLAVLAFVKIISDEKEIGQQLDFDSYLRQSMDYTGLSTGNSDLCDFYIAESAIPRGGLGVFTSKPLAKGDPAQAWPDICIYLTDADTRKGTEIDTHTWQSYRFGAQFLGGNFNPRAACMGLVTLFNSMAMEEYASARPSAIRDLIHKNGGLDRARDPGAGAISQFYGATSVAIRDLDAGSELMLWDDGNGGKEYEKHGLKEDGRTELDIKVNPEPNRPPEWLQKHGMCADNIKVQTATDPSMGRGAFSRRFIQRGSVIAPAPLQIYPNRTKFSAPLRGDARRVHEKENEMLFEREQLLVNYAFQPKGSSLLLYPYGPGVGLINHATKDSGKINAKIQWSKNHMNHGAQWLESSLTLDQFWKMQYPGSLILDVVALRDIREGEEIFIDYGIEWERAWEKHIEKWKPFSPHKIYKYVYPWDEMSNYNNPIKPYRTRSELDKNPYAHNLMVVFDTRNISKGRKARMEWRQSSHWPESNTECSIVSRIYNAEKEIYVYEVQLWPNDDHTAEDGTPMMFVDYGVPHSAIRLVDRPYHSDQFIPSAFRHSIGFPEELTPPFFRNART